MITGYRGRYCAAGITSEGCPFVGQVVSARSAANRQRKAVISGNKIFVRHMNPANAENLGLVQYNAITTGNGFAVAANGQHGGELAENSSDFNSLTDILCRWGCEPDKTPRIACVIIGKKAWFGIALPSGEAAGREIALKEGTVHYLTTYTGNDEEIELPDRLVVEQLAISGHTEMAEFLYNLADPKYAVCASAALFREKWVFGVVNSWR